MFQDFTAVKDGWIRVRVLGSVLYKMCFRARVTCTHSLWSATLHLCQTPIKWPLSLKRLQRGILHSPTFNCWMSGELLHRPLYASELYGLVLACKVLNQMLVLACQRCRPEVFPFPNVEYRYTCTRLHGVTSQNTLVLIVTAVRTSNVTESKVCLLDRSDYVTMLLQLQRSAVSSEMGKA